MENSDIMKQYSKFWTSLVERFNEEKQGLIRPQKFAKHYLKIPTGTDGIHFEWFLVGYPLTEFQVALHFELKNNPDENSRLLTCFESRKEEFEHDFGEKLECGYRHNSTHMFLKRKTTSMDEATMEWGVNTMIKFYDYFKPTLDDVIKQRGL